MQVKELMLQAEKNRKRLVEVVEIAKAGHIGGGLSSMNMLTALYFRVMNVDPKNPKWADRDRFVMSKGHCVEALYSVLEARGFISKELTDTYGRFDTPLAGHPTIEVPGIEVNSGALGHGLPIGVGMAIAAKMDRKAWRTFVLMGDGEQGEGAAFGVGHADAFCGCFAAFDEQYVAVEACAYAAGRGGVYVVYGVLSTDVEFLPLGGAPEGFGHVRRGVQPYGFLADSAPYALSERRHGCERRGVDFREACHAFHGVVAYVREGGVECETADAVGSCKGEVGYFRHGQSRLRECRARHGERVCRAGVATFGQRQRLQVSAP